MVDGCFDPLHRGHLKYFAAARALGAPVLCNVAPDAYVAGKHPPFLPEEHRTTLIDALRDIDFTHLNRGRTTADVLQELRPRYYVKGSDWRGRLPEQETSLCRELGIEVAYVEVTPDASRNILGEFARRRSSELESQTSKFEEALGKQSEPTGAALSPTTLMEALCGELKPTAVHDLSQADPGPNSTVDLVVGYWDERPLPLAGLAGIVRRAAALTSRYVCITAAFHPCAEHLLSLGDGKALGSDGAPRPARELVRVLFALEGFRSRRDVEARVELPSGQGVLVMERTS